MSRRISTRKRKPHDTESLDELHNNSKSNKARKTVTRAEKSSTKTREKVLDASKYENECYWLMKSEPESRIENGHEMKFGLDDLKSSQDQTTHWDGVRNYEARNHMKSMKLGQRAFFYHSNCKKPGLVAIMQICKEAYVDHTAFDKKDPHYDPKSDPSSPKWFMVDVKYERDLKRFISLAELKHYHHVHKREGDGALKDLALFTRSRLSVQSIRKEEWDFILSLEEEKPVEL